MGSRRWRRIIATAISSKYQNATSSLLRRTTGGKIFKRKKRKSDIDKTLHHRTYTKVRDVDANGGRSIEMARESANDGNDKRLRSDPTTVLQTAVDTGKGLNHNKTHTQALSEAQTANSETQTPTGENKDYGNSDNYNNDNSNHTSSSMSSKSDTDTFKEAGEEEESPRISVVAKRRKVSFKVGFAETEIYEIPVAHGTDCTKEDLYYSDDDYDRFRASELKRYNKMVAKKLQKMVQEKIQPEINEAVANGATLEDIEAMVPKTHEEMVAYLGGEEKIRGAVASSFGSQLKGKDKNEIPKKQPTSSLQSSVDIKTIENASDANASGKKDCDNGMDIGTNQHARTIANTIPNSGTIRTSRSSICKARNSRKIEHKSRKNGGMASVLEDAAEATAAVVETETHKEEEGDNIKETSKIASTVTTTISSLKEIDAMVPKTHAEMVAYLGAKRSSLEQLELSPKGPSTKWTVRSSPHFLEKLSTPNDDDADASIS